MGPGWGHWFALGALGCAWHQFAASGGFCPPPRCHPQPQAEEEKLEKLDVGVPGDRQGHPRGSGAAGPAREGAGEEGDEPCKRRTPGERGCSNKTTALAAGEALQERLREREGGTAIPRR